jgi:hypothetical protein
MCYFWGLEAETTNRIKNLFAIFEPPWAKTILIIWRYRLNDE